MLAQRRRPALFQYAVFALVSLVSVYLTSILTGLFDINSLLVLSNSFQYQCYVCAAIIYSFSVGISFRRQNLTSTDVIF